MAIKRYKCCQLQIYLYYIPYISKAEIDNILLIPVVDHTDWMTDLAPTDRAKSVRNNGI